MGGHFVLVGDRIHFLFCVIHKDELRAFLHAFHGAVFGAFVGGLDAAFAVGDVTGPTAVGRECQRGGDEDEAHSYRETCFHRIPLLEFTVPWLPRRYRPARLCRRIHSTSFRQTRCAQKKIRGGCSGILPLTANEIAWFMNRSWKRSRKCCRQ